MLRTLGYSREELIDGHLKWDALAPLERRDDDGSARKMASADGNVVPWESELLRKDGTSVAVLGWSGRLETERLAIAIDITDRKRAEHDLRASEARFSRLAESGVIGISYADPRGIVYEGNDAYVRMLGYSHRELAAGTVHWDVLTPPEWMAANERAARQLASGGVATPWEAELLRKDGARVPVLMGVATIEDSRFVSFVVDLTDQKRAEEALRRSENQLRQSQKMDAIGRLASGIAHDFNNILSVILSSAELMIGQMPDGDALRSDAQDIQTAATRAAALTRQLLMFGRQQIVEPRVLDLNVIVLDMRRMLERTLGPQVVLTTLPTRALGKVRADPSSIEQILMNLAVNARDAMPLGGKLTIETADVLLDDAFAAEHIGVHAGKHVMLAVSDTGAGMDAATRARIFEPFFTTKEVGKGTGLGLSTVFGIAQMSGGTVWAYSEVGLGTTFKVYLPSLDEEVETVDPAPEPTTLRGTETILLVEDDDQVRSLTRTALGRYGYHVLESGTWGEALLHSEQHVGVIDLLLTDVVMPQMTGPEVAERLTILRPGMKVLYMSGYTNDAVVRHGVLTASLAFLQKPITPGSLARKVREVLDKRPSRAPSERSP